MDDQFSRAAIWRRRSFRLGEVIADPLRHEIRVGARTVRVEPRLMAVLTELAAHGDSPATREYLLAAAWPEDAADEALTLAISRLRRALGAHSGLIATIPKVGYRLTTPPSPLDDVPAALPNRARAASAGRVLQVSAFAAVLVLGLWIGAYGAVWAHRDDFAGASAGSTLALNP